MLKAVLFDVDGVLLDSDEQYVELYKNVGEVLGLKPPEGDFFRKRFGIAAEKIIPEAYGKNPEAIKIFKKMDEEMKLELMEGVREVLQKVQIKKGIVSTKVKELIEKHLHEIIDEFDVVVGYEDTVGHKPNPDPLLFACNELNVEPADAVYIGDAMADWEMARDAGAKFIGFVSGGATEEEFRNAGVETIVHSMKELEDVMKDI